VDASPALTTRTDTARVQLVEVDEPTLDALVDAAVRDAAPDEVTAPFDDGATWSEQRVDWLRELHRSRRAGLDGPLREATWAVRSGDEIVGQIRLKRTGDAGVMETGAWLTRGARGRGIGVAALQAAIDRAVAYGASAVYAETTIGNVRAQGVLRRLGFVLSRGKTPDEVKGLLRLTR
jgi:ribosomal-protein-alanine N-acetyltransferase